MPYAKNTFIRSLLYVLLLSQSSASMASPQQDAAKKQDQGSTTMDPKTTLEDGTPVKLRISQTVSSADAHLNDRVEFEVLEDIKVADNLIIPKGVKETDGTRGERIRCVSSMGKR
jgi:hypothetical protein